MPLYSYKAVDRSGKEFLGEKTAKDSDELHRMLRDEGLIVVHTEDALRESAHAPGIFGALSSRFEIFMGVPLFEKLVFARNLAVMIHAGLPLTRALHAVSEETKNKPFAAALKDIAEAITKGKSFADALGEHNDIFGDLFVHMVQAGEISGKLDHVLNLLAHQMKKDYELRARVRGAMLYPGIIITALIIIGALMMTYIVPTLAQALKDLNVELPLSTKIIIGASSVFSEYALVFFALFISIMVLFVRYIRSARGKPVWDRVTLHIPLFGTLIKKMNTARLTRILAYLLASGIPIIRALGISSSVVGNTLFQKSIAELSKDVSKGKLMGEYFHSHSDLYDPLMAEMVSAGEETGKISQMLLEIAVFFEQDIHETTKNLSSVIEPLLMVFIGVVVGFFAISVLQPIYGSLGSI